MDTSNYSQSTLSKSYLPDVVEGQCRRIIRCITRGMDSRNERNLLISRHSPLAYIRNRIPLVFSSLHSLSLSFVRLFVHVQISSISAPFFPRHSCMHHKPPSSPVSRELLSRSEELFMLPSNDLLSSELSFPPRFSAHPHALPLSFRVLFTWGQRRESRWKPRNSS